MNEDPTGQKIEGLDNRLKEVEFNLRKNTRDTSEILTILNNTRGFASFLKWSATVGAGLYGLWQLFETITRAKNG